jgi:hypothetical protein
LDEFVDFELALRTLLSEFARLKIRCAAIGGFALRHLTALAYTRAFQSEYRHPEAA